MIHDRCTTGTPAGVRHVIDMCVTGVSAGVHDLPAAGSLAPGLRHTLSVTPHHQWLPHRWHNHHQPVTGLVLLCCCMTCPCAPRLPLCPASEAFPCWQPFYARPAVSSPLAFTACNDQCLVLVTECYQKVDRATRPSLIALSYGSICSANRDV